MVRLGLSLSRVNPAWQLCEKALCQVHLGGTTPNFTANDEHWLSQCGRLISKHLFEIAADERNACAKRLGVHSLSSLPNRSPA